MSVAGEKPRGLGRGRRGRGRRHRHSHDDEPSQPDAARPPPCKHPGFVQHLSGGEGSCRHRSKLFSPRGGDLGVMALSEGAMKALLRSGSTDSSRTPCSRAFKAVNRRGAWGAQSVKCLTLDFGPGHDLTVREFEPHAGFGVDSAEPAWDSVSLPVPPLLVPSLPLSLPPTLKINKYILKKQQKDNNRVIRKMNGSLSRRELLLGAAPPPLVEKTLR